MRMWLVNPDLLCRKHLLGEHVELHMLVGTIRKGRSIQGFLDNRLISTSKIKSRHDQLASEMVRRGFRHQSVLRYTDRKIKNAVSIQDNLIELARRCAECRARIEGIGNSLHRARKMSSPGR